MIFLNFQLLSLNFKYSHTRTSNNVLNVLSEFSPHFPSENAFSYAPNRINQWQCIHKIIPFIFIVKSADSIIQLIIAQALYLN